MPMLTVEDLHVRFYTREGIIAAVNGVGFTLEKGRVLGILGESGSGKSVTLRAILRLLPPLHSKVSGRVLLHGTDLFALSEPEMRHVRGRKMATIFQEPMTALDPVFTVGRQIEETIVRHEGVTFAAAHKRARELLEMVQIPSPERRLSSYPHELSGGMRQRAMIAIALSCRPELLLADEPTTALDATVQAQILLLLRSLQEQLGMAVILVTHDIGVITEVADEQAVMYAGRFVEYGPVRTVMRTPRHPYTEGLFNSTAHRSQHGKALYTIPGSPPDPSNLASGCSFAPRCPLVEDGCLKRFPDETWFDTNHLVRCFVREM
ncbi:MAG: ABC transporter ATP-binding protein [Pseudomonadota bacterium]